MSGSNVTWTIYISIHIILLNNTALNLLIRPHSGGKHLFLCSGQYILIISESVTIRPQAIRLLQIRPIQIRLHAHWSIYKFVPMSKIRPIQGIVSLYDTRRQFIIKNKSF